MILATDIRKINYYIFLGRTKFTYHDIFVCFVLTTYVYRVRTNTKIKKDSILSGVQNQFCQKIAPTKK